MSSYPELPDIVLKGFCDRRRKPRLPPRYNWEDQIRKYCPSLAAMRLTSKRNKRFNYVFCHRGLYDRAMRIPENSTSAIHNGLQEKMYCHEIDARMGTSLGDTYLAHDEVAGRVTSKKRHWTSLKLNEILETALVTRRYSIRKGDFASSYMETEDKVPDMADILREHMDGTSPCFQLDLRGKDLPAAIVYYLDRQLESHMMLLKGYNFHYQSCRDLEEAIQAEAHRGRGRLKTFQWRNLERGPHIMMVFYSQPIIALALKTKGIDPERSPAARLNLDFDTIYQTTMRQVSSYLTIKNQILGFIPEIVHTGLGLGYNKHTGIAKNPLDGSHITDPEVILESRVDRAMIEVALQLRESYPELHFSSCTRLCDLRTEDKGEWVADMRTGRLKPIPRGQRGIQAKIRAIHGGLYPQTDIVVADDPWAEIAARTWIDEYAKLDRSKLLTMTYDAWLAQAEPDVVAAVNALNGPFLPNTWSGSLDEEWNVLF